MIRKAKSMIDSAKKNKETLNSNDNVRLNRKLRLQNFILEI